MKLASAAVQTNRIPQRVFRSEYRRFAFVEFDLFSGPSFWSLLQALAASSLDKCITTVAVEPHPVDYFHKEFGVYGAIQVDAVASSNDYYDALSSHPEAWPADSLLDNSFVLTWFSESVQWLIWGERTSELAIVALRDRFEPQVRSLAEKAGIRLFSLDDALSLASLGFRNRTVPERWETDFRRNYGG